MQWVPDKTGKFAVRPKYSDEELEAMCDSHMSAVLLNRHGDKDRIPTEDDLTVLLETCLSVELDSEADFSSEPGWVQGTTDFFPDRSPFVQIRKGLKEDRFHRYKSTLVHEGGHVLCLAEAFGREENLLNKGAPVLRCRGNESYDWKERQADYCAGAWQMPIRLLELRLGERPKRDGRHSVNSNHGRDLIVRVSDEFDVSRDAAGVRLISTGYLYRRLPPQLRLFKDTERRMEARHKRSSRPVDSNQGRDLIAGVSKEVGASIDDGQLYLAFTDSAPAIL